MTSFDFKDFLKTPNTFSAKEFQAAEPGVKSVFLAGPAYKGKPTRSFAWYAVPEGASKDKPVPGIVLVHGGLGSAFSSWVKYWTDRGFAAIAPDIFCGVPFKDGRLGNINPVQRHEHSGPNFEDRFNNAFEEPSQQWPFHALAAIMNSHSFLASLPGVDTANIGITGISWGGFATALAASFDSRFRFAVPVYGCGGFQTLKLVPDNIPMKKLKQWCFHWDPINSLSKAQMPFLWVSGTSDFSFDIFNLNQSSKQPKSQTFRALRINMEHGQTQGMSAPEIVPFAKAVTARTEYPFFSDAAIDSSATTISAQWHGFDTSIQSVFVVATRSADCWNDSLFRNYPAMLDSTSNKICGDLPEDWRAAFLNVTDSDGLVHSTEVFFAE